MANCAITGKTSVFGGRISHSHRRSNRKFKVNLKRVHIIENGVHKRVWVSTRALRSGLVNRA